MPLPQPNTNNTPRNRSALTRSSSLDIQLTLPSLPSLSLSFSFTSTSTPAPHPSRSPGFLRRIQHGTQRLNLIEAPEENYSMSSSSSSSSSSGYVGIDWNSDDDDGELRPLRGSEEALEFVLAHTEDAVPEAISEERNGCPVCLLPFWLGGESEGEAEVCHLPKVTRCGHFFGMQCLMDDLMRRGTRCAFCRQELDGEENGEEDEEEDEEDDEEDEEEDFES